MWRLPARTGHVNASTKIIVLGQALSANMQVVNAAMDDGRFRVAEVATASRFFCRYHSGCAGSLECPSLKVEPRGADEGAERHGANSSSENAFVLLPLRQCGRHQRDPDEQEKPAGDQREVTQLLPHQDAFLVKGEFLMIPRRKKVHREDIGFQS